MVELLCTGCRERDARIAEFEARLAELERIRRERTYLRDEARAERDLRSLTGESAAMKAVRAAIRQVAPTDSTVLIVGETGTGKELVARAIHQLSPRRERLMVAVNCAALAPGVIASELFGHEAGAFTGAIRRRTGRFELAHQGTLFLDEVGELTPETQVMLLRAFAGAHDRARRRRRADPCGCPRHRGHSSGPGIGHDAPANSGWTCSSDSTSSRFASRRSASAAKTFPIWFAISCSTSPAASVSRSRTSPPLPSSGSPRTTGRVTCASWKTSSSGRSSSRRVIRWKSILNG